MKGKKSSRKSAAIRYKLFAHAYAKEPNATKAAILAGYSPKTAAVQGHDLLKIPKIQEQIDQIIAQRAHKLDVSAERVLSELAKMGFANMLDYMRVDEEGQFIVDFSSLTREQAAAIQEYTVDSTGGTGDGERKLVMRTRFKLADKTRNLELLGQHLKLFTEVHEHSGLEGVAEAIGLIRSRKVANGSDS